jgi:hypothetical protein
VIHRPLLGDDPVANHRTLQDILDTPGGGELSLPSGRHQLADGLRVPGGWTLRGDETVLVAVERTGHPVLHVVGSDVTISDLTLHPAPADPGEHGGDRGTGLTVGEYLYRSAPAFISGVHVRRVHVEHGDLRTANGVAVMGAARDINLQDLSVRGGYTGLAVHWGAVGADVSSIVGRTYHPHRLTVTGLRVHDAIEGFYLSSIHDVHLTDACLHNVEMGFRLLPGDNTDRFASADVGARISIDDVCVRWTGPRYAVRVSGWGRSEIDGLVTVLPYRDTTIRQCHLAGHGTSDTWSPLLFEQATGVTVEDLRVTTSTAECTHPA